MKDIKEILRSLMMESYGALGWLEGVVALSDRALVYKARRLRVALADAEECLAQLPPKVARVMVEGEGGA